MSAVDRRAHVAEAMVAARASTLTVEARGAARILRIDRPGARNALDAATLRAIAASARTIGRDHSARGIVVTGTGDIFASGGDLREFGARNTADGGRRLARAGRDAIDALLAAGVPCIAALNGDAYGGGCEIAAACDYRVVERSARLHWAQARLGVTTGWGGTARLLRLVSSGTATRWILHAATVQADEALALGFADQVVDDGTSVATACAFIETTVAVGTRRSTRRQLDLLRLGVGTALDAALAAEIQRFARGWASEEHKRAVERFLSRRRAIDS